MSSDVLGTGEGLPNSFSSVDKPEIGATNNEVMVRKTMSARFKLPPPHMNRIRVRH
jgi:hypothetical protein